MITGVLKIDPDTASTLIVLAILLGGALAAIIGGKRGSHGRRQ